MGSALQACCTYVPAFLSKNRVALSSRELNFTLQWAGHESVTRLICAISSWRICHAWNMVPVSECIGAEPVCTIK